MVLGRCPHPGLARVVYRWMSHSNKMLDLILHRVACEFRKGLLDPQKLQKQFKLELNAMLTGVDILTKKQKFSFTIRPNYNCMPNGALNLNFLSPNLKRRFGR